MEDIKDSVIGIDQLPEFVHRIHLESNDLQEKIVKLKTFTESEKFSSLNKQMQDLLKTQHSAMIVYNNVLVMRLDLLIKDVQI